MFHKGQFYQGGKLEGSGGKFMIYFLLRGKLRFFQALVVSMFLFVQEYRKQVAGNGFEGLLLICLP